MNVAHGASLGNDFASALPELSAPATAMRPEQPQILALNEALAAELGIDPAWLSSEAGVRFMLGNELPESARPVAQVYAGHQFGSYNPRLGDGRAVLLGEIGGDDGRLWDLHLKGSGPTPLSRGDGYAAVGPMLREYLMGEAMHALGVPTTRALAVIATGQHVMRPESLDPLPGAVLVRTAASHLRVGSFQFVRSTGDIGLLRRLADHAIARHYPMLVAEPDPYLALLEAVVAAQARLIAQWQLVGFVHGVMNTDNVTISGETIDYGPCAFIDDYDTGAVFSSIDEVGRYAFGRQPAIAHWNLARFAESLLPLLGQDTATDEARIELAQGALAQFGPRCDAAWLTGMRAKLGLGSVSPERLSDTELTQLVGEMLGELHTNRIDYTRFFRVLGDAACGDDAPLRELFARAAAAGGLTVVGGAVGAGQWFDRWLALSPNEAEMSGANPAYIPRNHHVEVALDAANEGDLTSFAQLFEALSRPFEARPGLERYELPPAGAHGRFVTYCGT